MDSARFTTTQRLSCQMMNPDLFKASDRTQTIQPPPKPNRSKSEPTKPEVVVDVEGKRCYYKGKILGKVAYHLPGFI